MKTNIFQAIKLTFICVIFFVGVYPLVILGVAQLAPDRGRGETFSINNKVIGYKNIAQKFTADKYFWPRPSVAGYNAAGSGGSNKGPSNPEYLKGVQANIDTFLIKHPYLKKEDVPAEMVTASGSGLDPDISPNAAAVQIKRVAKARNIPEEKVKSIVADNTSGPLLALFGPSKVNVLKLNIALDNLKN